MSALSVYITDCEQRRLVPIVGSAEAKPIDMDGSTGGTSFTTASQIEEQTGSGTRVWSVVVDGAARLGVMAVTVALVDAEVRALAWQSQVVRQGCPSSVLLRGNDKASALEVGALPGRFDLAEWCAVDADDELAVACPLHDLAVGAGNTFRVEAFGDPVDFETGGAHAVRGEPEHGAARFSRLDEAGGLPLAYPVRDEGFE
jgi:hypothetical protein